MMKESSPTIIIDSAKHLTKAKRFVLSFVIKVKPLTEFCMKAYSKNLNVL